MAFCKAHRVRRRQTEAQSCFAEEVQENSCNRSSRNHIRVPTVYFIRLCNPTQLEAFVNCLGRYAHVAVSSSMAATSIFETASWRHLGAVEVAQATVPRHTRARGIGLCQSQRRA